MKSRCDENENEVTRGWTRARYRRQKPPAVTDFPLINRLSVPYTKRLVCRFVDKKFVGYIDNPRYSTDSTICLSICLLEATVV